MTRLQSRWAWGLMVVYAGALLAAAQPKDPPKTVDLQVWSIRATTKNKDISPELREIADKLKRESKFTGFKLEQRAAGTTKVGEAYATALPGSYKAKVTPQKADDKRVTLAVEVLKGDKQQVNATVTIKARQFQLFGGLSLDGDDQLIVAVSGK
ncbi:MAG: hypothetical protein KA383_04380 [Phycisphaerae bacterium]|nr:hypothetical protein [Phycisphaerae bacterium]